jgi:hypothetical protein
MADTVQGSLHVGINLTTTFGTGTAGSATETNKIETGLIQVDANQAAGLAFTKVWSKRYTNLAAPVTIDLTALTGVNGGSIDFTTTGVRLIQALNCDPTAGHDVAMGPGASNGFAAAWDDATATTTVYGGMPGAGVTNAVAKGNLFVFGKCSAASLTVDSTHKTITLTPVGTVTDFVLVIAA